MPTAYPATTNTSRGTIPMPCLRPRKTSLHSKCAPSFSSAEQATTLFKIILVLAQAFLHDYDRAKASMPKLLIGTRSRKDIIRFLAKHMPDHSEAHLSVSVELVLRYHSHLFYSVKRRPPESIRGVVCFGLSDAGLALFVGKHATRARLIAEMAL